MSEYQRGFKAGVKTVAAWMESKARDLEDAPQVALAFVYGAQYVRKMEPPDPQPAPEDEG